MTRVAQQHASWEVTNLGSGGTGYLATIEDSRIARQACGQDRCPSYREQIEAAAAEGPQIVLVSGGRNDAGQPVEDLGTAIPDFYRALRRELPEAQIIATSPIWDDDPAPEALSLIDDLVRQSVTAVGGTYVNLGDPLRGRPDLLSDDGVHPNDRGYERIARVIESRLPAGLQG